MIQLIIDNSHSKIAGCNVQQQKELRDLLSYSIEAQAMYFAKNYGNNKKYLLDKYGGFPTGLLYLILGYLGSNGIKYQTTDLRVKPVSNIGMFKLNLE